ncbi:hypothetical protein B0H67DRAFT_278478 [Lasiosphaeris hirsuta]|uniref:Uncharacterized protein n=1 Tax=Lasiosphaeris hirsuta TaxID=260670 RepID=A0AA40A8F3_9PEZI|nr:hypothetical protein B0H67DRAFT_278478 [Lasiosphaeris hirsuta]
MQRATPPQCPAAESATIRPRMPVRRGACIWNPRGAGQWWFGTVLATSHCTIGFVGRAKPAIDKLCLRAGQNSDHRRPQVATGIGTPPHFHAPLPSKTALRTAPRHAVSGAGIPIPSASRRRKDSRFPMPLSPSWAAPFSAAGHRVRQRNIRPNDTSQFMSHTFADRPRMRNLGRLRRHVAMAPLGAAMRASPVEKGAYLFVVFSRCSHARLTALPCFPASKRTTWLHSLRRPRPPPPGHGRKSRLAAHDVRGDRLHAASESRSDGPLCRPC